MTIRLTCPECRAKLKSKTALPPGRRRKCPRCGTYLQLWGTARLADGGLPNRALLPAVLSAGALLLLVLSGILLAVCLSGRTAAAVVGSAPKGSGNTHHRLRAVNELAQSRPPTEAPHERPEPSPPVAAAEASLALPVDSRQPGRLLVDDGRFTGPYTYKNLSVYLIHGPDTLPATMRLVPLEKALQDGQVSLRVFPGGPVSIQNRSGAGVYVQGGDILKGAFQDQTVAHDYLVGPEAPQEGTPLTSYCVEHGRSGPRGSEPLTEWHSATEQLPGLDLRLGLSQGNQQAIWDGIVRLQDKLQESVGKSVANPISPTSLALTLENTRPLIEGYVQALSAAPGASADAVGVVVVIDGKIYSADQYASHELFQALWPKLLRTGAVAALAEPVGESTPALPTAVELHRFLSGERGSGEPVTFSLRDAAHDNLLIHRAVWSR